jgi:hypothetical protein
VFDLCDIFRERTPGVKRDLPESSNGSNVESIDFKIIYKVGPGRVPNTIYVDLKGLKSEELL